MEFTQSPNEKITYKQTITGDTADSAVWTIEPSAGVTLDGQVETSAASFITVSGLTLGKKYFLSVVLTGGSGQEFERACTIICRNPLKE